MYNPLLLTKSTTFIIGPVAQLLGYLMNGIFWVLDKIGIPNIGLAIILFTIIIYMCLLPLTIKQQKFSKLSALMNPEIQKIQAKYKNKKDNDSMVRMNEETQAVYKKYGVSPSGSCIQLLIQMPILFALYRVIYNIPAYVTQVKDAFFPLVDNLIGANAAEYLQNTSSAAQFASQFNSDNFVNNVGDTVANTFIDVLNRFSTADWTALGQQFPTLSDEISNTYGQLEVFNNFLGLNIGNSPWYTLKDAFSNGSILGIIAAIAVPLLAALTQLINVALMPQPQSTSNDPNDQAAQMQNSMKTMNYLMPIMSAWFCFTLPAGMGLYWIAGSVIRSIQQVAINRHINNMDMDAYIARNAEKAAKKGGKSISEKMMDKMTGAAAAESAPTKSLTENANTRTANKGSKGGAKLDQLQGYNDGGRRYKSGSLSAKANMVRDYNEHKNRENK